ncbi:hypothetical protein TREMEDRAFT_63752 [Tremella mesenterica DSM 1558]|uniref:uncharacterized protein n=1 Tax=Tremella mesenterica (strain ATCC 24925 / CBS 8224 / DSM 1558 / NBRC 9311 / NRRL Y-6157 / RJB 2259-6 / UBC 559-6) TaxID=578456 RepID=UPI0003F493EB|nr:uncharacterized protein TREMEDRAFT_63752 [Tremella mesenterica DSM 1558]EIW67862.1 hypothetical protein TREMEDRAFT_63752 [Tremella mesenterica DSM 1558]
MSTTQPTLDVYRSLSRQIKKHLAPYVPTDQPPSIPSLLGIDPISYSSRLAGKTLPLATTVSPIVSKSNVEFGDGSKLRVGQDKRKVLDGEKTEMGGIRRMKKRRGGIRKGREIPYEFLLPLHYMHTHYLISLFSLPPLPSTFSHPQPSSSSNVGSSSNIPLIPAPSNPHFPNRPISSFTPNNSASPHNKATPLKMIPSKEKNNPLPTGVSTETIQSKLVKADFTGAILLILSSRNPSLVGIKGIVIEETYGTFLLVPIDGKVRVVPKKGSMFRFEFPAYAPSPENDFPTNTINSHLTTSSKQTISHPSSSSFILDEGETSAMQRRMGNESTEQKKESAVAHGIEISVNESVEQTDIPWEQKQKALYQPPEADTMELHLSNINLPRIQIDILGDNFCHRSVDRAGRKFRPTQIPGSGWAEEHVRLPVEEGFGDLIRKLEREERDSGQVKSLSSDRRNGKERSKVKVVGRRKRDKSRRKDPPAWGKYEPFV